MNKENETLELIAELEGQAKKAGQEWHRYHLLFLKGLVVKQEESVLETFLLCFTWGVWGSIFKVIQYHSITSGLRLEWASRDGLAQPSAQSGDSQKQWLRAAFSWVLSISRIEIPLLFTMPLHNFLQCLTTLFYFQLLEFIALPLVLLLDATEKSMAPPS